MDLKVLHNFLVVAQEGNITKAAALVHLTQSALSRQIQALERDLGVKLLERQKYRVSLTAEGMLLQRRACELLSLEQQARTELQPDTLPEVATCFYCGNSPEAKAAVAELLHDFGWSDTFDLGSIEMARYTEMLGAFWVPVYQQLGSMHWGLRLVR